MTKFIRIGLLMLGGRSWIGGSEYIKNIILALSSLPNEIKESFEICLFYSGAAIDLDTLNQLKPHLNISCNLDNELQPRTIINLMKWKIRSIFLDETCPQMIELLKKKGINFVYPYLMSPKEQTSSLQACTWFPDFQYKYYKHLYPEAEIRDWDKSIKKISKLRQTIILSSENAARDLQKFFPDSQIKVKILNFRTPTQDTWYEKDVIAVQKKYHLPVRFFLVSNQFWQHKNHLIIIDALKMLRTRSIFPKVVFTGSIYDYRDPSHIDKILQNIHIYGLASQTYILGLIPKSDQMQLMRGSLAVIQPSLFEGWSTVLEDARCLGKKVLLSDFPVHIEQNLPNSVFFERNSTQELAELIRTSWEIYTPMPDIQQETLARLRNMKEVQEFGYRFLAIAKGENIAENC